MIPMKIRLILIACLALMTSCGKEIPDDIIQPELMEDILYDYHLSLSMTQSSKNTEKEAQKNYIYKKYKISEALFDSSMVWYTRESKELMDIYQNLDNRFKREHAHINRLLETREEEISHTSVSGDTVDVWRKGNIHWFSRTPLNRQLAFEIRTDTTFHERDAFLWNMDYHFFAEGVVLMGRNVVYDNDSVIGMTKLIRTSGPQSIYLHTDSVYPIKKLNGFIYIPDDSVSNEPKVLVHNITLTRYHQKQKSVEEVEEEIVTEETKNELQKPQSVDSKRKSRNKRMDKLEKIE